jgi:hypothetical protein
VQCVAGQVWLAWARGEVGCIRVSIGPYPYNIQSERSSQHVTNHNTHSKPRCCQANEGGGKLPLNGTIPDMHATTE